MNDMFYTLCFDLWNVKCMNEWMNSPKVWQLVSETSCIQFMHFGLSAMWQHNFTFQRSWQVLNQSQYSPHCMQRESSLLHSQVPITHFCPELDQSTPYSSFQFLENNVLVFSHLCLDFPNSLFHSGLTTKTMCTCLLLSPIYVTCPGPLILLIWSSE